MVRKKQQNPYHGTKEHIDTLENTTPLVAKILTLPQRQFPPLLRFAVIIKNSSDPEGTKNKILEEGMEYELTQGDEIQRSLKEMSVLDLRTALKDLGLKVTGKKQDLVNRLIGAQSTKGKDRNGRRESKTQKVKGSTSPASPVASRASPAPADPVKDTKEEESTNKDVIEQGESKDSVKIEAESEVKADPMESDEKKEAPQSTNGEMRSLPDVENKEENKEDEDEDEESESTSPYAKLKVTELRNELRKRGLNTAGRKDELIERLEADNAASSNKSVSPSNSQEKIESSTSTPQVDSLSPSASESEPTSPGATTNVSTPPVATSPSTAKSSPSKLAKRRERESGNQAIDQKAKRKSIQGVIDSEEEEDSSDVFDDDDTDEYDDAESRRKKKVEGPKSNKGGKNKGGRRDSGRTAKRRRRDF
eukprot:TRINITY_DN407_c0_g1_i1.p1 TRINITY_DN407_c0_g1~~TRINITY_DN407_c0_g1_i1.p1  ORF type:complete len:421 (+),score=119.25 TRINITY_DN407_c0_g1_i1:663-1925(+)